MQIFYFKQIPKMRRNTQQSYIKTSSSNMPQSSQISKYQNSQKKCVHVPLIYSNLVKIPGNQFSNFQKPPQKAQILYKNENQVI
uniref:Ovule protein n=1 Tax=Panagrolaimus sp. ES5 TaxID=591445 RepID=A0AC34F6K9_9BILA